jgi:hypothetical protein
VFFHVSQHTQTIHLYHVMVVDYNNVLQVCCPLQAAQGEISCRVKGSEQVIFYQPSDSSTNGQTKGEEDKIFFPGYVFAHLE